MINTQLTPFDVKKVEERYNAKFVGEFPTKLKNGNWGNAGAVFYQENPDKEKGHSHYFGLYYNYAEKKAVIYNADYLAGYVFQGVEEDGEYKWSREVHDFRPVAGGFIDGGFDYFRAVGDVKLVDLVVLKGKVTKYE